MDINMRKLLKEGSDSTSKAALVMYLVVGLWFMALLIKFIVSMVMG